MIRSTLQRRFYWSDGELVRTIIGQHLNASDVENDAARRSIRITMPNSNLCRIIIHGKRHSREFVFESAQRIAFFSLTISVNRRFARNEAFE
jgi:hypothetical protein